MALSKSTVILFYVGIIGRVLSETAQAVNKQDSAIVKTNIFFIVLCYPLLFIKLSILILQYGCCAISKIII